MQSLMLKFYFFKITDIILENFLKIRRKERYKTPGLNQQELPQMSYYGANTTEAIHPFQKLNDFPRANLQKSGITQKKF